MYIKADTDEMNGFISSLVQGKKGNAESFLMVSGINHHSAPFFMEKSLIITGHGCEVFYVSSVFHIDIIKKDRKQRIESLKNRKH